MPNIHNRDFSGGWQPSSDAANIGESAFPRIDNLEPDENGVLRIRRGTEVLSDIGTSLVHINKVEMQELGGNQVVLSAAPTSAYADGSGLGFTTDGSTSDDITFGAVDGHAIITHGTVHKKYDGTTVRNWGIEAPLEPPSLDNMALVSKTIATCAQADAEFAAAAEGTRGYATGYDGVANSATTLTPAAGTGRGEMTYTFASTQNLLNFSGAEGGDFDQFEFYFNNADPTKFQFLQINFGLTAGSDPFASDGYFYTFGSELTPIGLTKDEIIRSAQTAIAKAVDPEPEKPGPPPVPVRDPPDRDNTEERRDRRQRENL